MKPKDPDTISLDEAFKQIDARRRAENPWTAADEARREAKSQKERAALEAWQAAHPDPVAEEDDEDEDDEESA